MLTSWKRLIKALLVTLSFFLMPLSVFAFSVSPAIVELTIEPGKISRGVITVKNDEPNDQTFYVSFQKFIAQGNTGRQTFLPPDDISGLPSWLSIDKPMFTLAPGQVQLINYAISPPKTAQPGGNYAAIFVSNRPPTQSSDQQNVMMGARTGVLVFATIPGEVKKDITLNVFSQSTTSGQQYLWTTELKNTGTVHSAPTGTIEITNLFGQTVAILPFNKEQARVLPQSIRRYQNTWHPKDTLAFFNEGPLKITLKIDELSIQQTQKLLLFPKKTLFIALSVIAVFCVIGFTKKRKK